MVPAALIGVLFSEELETLFDQQILLVGAMLWLTGLLLFIADRAKNTDRDVTYGSALIVGIAQAIAILPGISRSGATISTSVILGIDRTRAARFSFLMVVPLILGKVAKDLIDGMSVKIFVRKLSDGHIVVPKSAVVIRDNMEVVFKFIDGKSD